MHQTIRVLLRSSLLARGVSLASRPLVALAARLAGTMATALALGLATVLATALATVPAQAVPLHVDGKVVDERGRPVADARVVLRQEPSLFDSLDAVLDKTPDADSAGHPLDETKTDSEGRFRLAAGEPALVRVTVDAEGFASQMISIEPLVAPVTLAPVMLPPSVAVEVRVTSSGKPVADAVVAMVSRQRPATEWSTRTRVVRTDAEGVAEIVWPQTDQRIVMVSASELLWNYDERPASRADRIDVSLEPGEPETLFLHDAQGLPLSDLVVAVGRGWQAVGRSGEDGRVVVRLPARGENSDGEETELRVLGEDGHYLRGQVSAVPDEEVSLQIPGPLAVDGRIFDRDTREPLADALVWAYARASEAVRTDSDGRFRIFALEGVPIYSAGAPGYQEERGGVDEAETGLGLQPIRAIVGRVVDRSGVGIARAEVVASPDLLKARSSNRLTELIQSTSRGVTDSEGRFRLEGLLPDAGYDVEARRSGYAAASKRVTFTPDELGERSVELVLDPGRAGVGQVLDEADRPVAGAEVGLFEPRGEMPRIRVGPPEEPTPVAWGITGADGEFRLADLGEGSFRLEVSAEGYAPLTVPGIEVGPYVEEEIDLGVAMVVRAAEIRGRVVDGEDEPVAGAQIFSEIPATFPGENLPSLPEAISDVEGRFVIGGLAPDVGRRVVARAEGYVEAELAGVVPTSAAEAADGESEAVLVLYGPSTIRGRVVGPDGEPVSGATIGSGLVRDAGSGSSFQSLSAARTDGSGAFELTDLPPGQIQLRIRAEGYRNTEGHLVPVAPGEVVDDVLIQLEAGVVLAGRVVDGEGDPVPRASISSRQPERGRAGRGPYARSGSDGTFRLEGMPPGTSELTAHHESYGMAVETVELELGQDAFLEIRLSGASVSGQVVTAAGELAGGTTVGLRRFDPDAKVIVPFNVLEAVAKSDGSFEIEGIPDGTWGLVAEHPEYGMASSDEFEAVGAPVAGLYLQLQPFIELTGKIHGLSFDQLSKTEVTAVSQFGRRVGEVSHDGSYRVGRLAPGDWGIVADAGFRQVNESLTIESGALRATLDLDFGGGEALEGIVLLDGRPLDAAEVTWVRSAPDEGDSVRVARTDHQGRFRLEALDEGAARLLVQHLKSSLRYDTSVQLPRDEPLRLDIRTSSIFGRVVDARGATVAAVTVALEEVHPESEGEESRALRRVNPRPEVTDARGEFRFGGLTEGTWKLRAEKDGFVAAERSLELQAGSDVGPIVFVLERAEGDS